MSQTPQLRIDIEQVALLSVTGHLDDAGLRELQQQESSTRVAVAEVTAE